jgi:hypothetical protein
MLFFLNSATFYMNQHTIYSYFKSKKKFNKVILSDEYILNLS